MIQETNATVRKMTDTDTEPAAADRPTMAKATLAQMVANTQIRNDVIMMTSLSFINASFLTPFFFYIDMMCGIITI